MSRSGNLVKKVKVTKKSPKQSMGPMDAESAPSANRGSKAKYSKGKKAGWGKAQQK